MKSQFTTRTAAEAVGWYGALAILSAYFLVSFAIIPANGLAYLLLNLTGSMGLITIALVKKVHQSVVLNIFWALVAIAAIVKLLL